MMWVICGDRTHAEIPAELNLKFEDLGNGEGRLFGTPNNAAVGQHTVRIFAMTTPPPLKKQLK